MKIKRKTCVVHKSVMEIKKIRNIEEKDLKHLR